MPLWGHSCPLLALAALTCLSEAGEGDGLACSRLALLSPLFYEPAWRYLESESEVAQSCQTLCDPMDCSLPSSSVHGIFQVIVLEWIAIFFSRGSSQPRDGTWVSCIVDRHFTICATRVVF